jgi:hypothetical protein
LIPLEEIPLYLVLLTDVTRQVPEDGLLLLTGDINWHAVRYLQLCEGLRTELSVGASGVSLDLRAGRSAWNLGAVADRLA